MISLATRLREGQTPRCPYCHDQLEAEAEAIQCPGCQTRHHAECVRELGVCTTYGCGEQLAPGEAAPNPEVREEIRARIRAGVARYARGVAGMERSLKPLGREQRFDAPGFKLADFASSHPELFLTYAVLLLLCAMGAPCFLMSLLS